MGEAHIQNRKAQLTVYIIVHMALIGALISSATTLALTRNDQIAMIIVAILADVIFVRSSEVKSMQKYKKRKVLLAICATGFYSSFASFAYRLFLTGDTRPTFSWQAGLCLMLGAIYFLPVVWGLLYTVEILSDKVQNGKYVPRKRDFWILFAVLLLCEIFVLCAFWPGGYSSDVMSVLGQAKGNAGLDDWQPVLYTLIFRAAMWIIPTPAIVFVLRAVCFVCLNTVILMLGRKKNIPLVLLCIIGAVFELLPNQVLQIVGSDKDFLYTMALLWGCYLLFLLIDQKSVLEKRWYKISIPLDLFFIAGLRHNGIMPVLFIFIFGVAVTIRHWKKLKTALIIPVMVGIIAVGIFKGPIYNALNVYPNRASTYTTMVCAVASCINKDLPLSEKTTKIMETVMPLSDGKNTMADLSDMITMYGEKGTNTVRIIWKICRILQLLMHLQCILMPSYATLM